ncbi:hypothetical protein ACWDDN_03900 [Streptomyces griseoruber]|uniref:hypothetical protein n=1 Tax=Streptomyces griseoruber TaxID=1943 RepID=UPI0037AD8634
MPTCSASIEHERRIALEAWQRARVDQLFTEALDHVGVEWKQANAKNISVARKASVALLDAHVGPKH